ncbi:MULTISPECIES: TetR/AcrR family transcriptional regulator [Pasteurellaceae]|uniref:TetR/AcrR family transcriptional regulator n=1 Tax=Pasteurella atlantica TaxID=2827233 RepID=A0AAW8CN69_9PAST|nr:TetR/AcrR family transcriptional regulator [Pasteurella atlantica]MBR0573664.1 TetR/AcrR family transcriptional regulator [Pasteurella atlantica]MDP8039419.1 TetR/AcrR family transcriptional regulator [Pasteurella atlantica]MDP8041511.1 TetR/AcrR family transcriptional regulator [Pasteurella atlantica]MDP8043564.1 TetR/AcrR family transcriptional regulator [Pasteurella atlantica]MDP8045732.1 TetR/AcrR family transcriptional regulator [Pasteurella atlantica]
MKRANNEAGKIFREQTILDAALTLFANKGFQATKMEDIATVVGISKGTIYLYFDNKEALFRKLITQQIGEKMQDWVIKLQEAQTLSDVFEQMADEMVILITETPLPKLLRILISESAIFPEMVMFYRKSVIKPWQIAWSQKLGNDEQAQCLFKLIMAPYVFSILSQEIFFADQPNDKEALRHLFMTQFKMIENLLQAKN